ncbi:MAG: hypothetical protein IPK82_24300 [Polyangiaceae bacterium]|nr:hypothetical protein [Polyangiaceae bacterium]
MRTSIVAAAAAAACVLMATQDSQASFYPPDYPICSARDTQTQGPFELIKDTKSPYSRNAQLTVAYRGYLRNSFPDNEINFYIRLNGNDIFIPASSGSNGDTYAYLNAGPRNCVICSPPPYDYQNAPLCATYEFAENQSSTWVCEGPSADEQEIFFWAFNDYGQQNAWDIQVAAESHGYWDSNWGWNYSGRFEPRTGCY